MCDGRVLRLGLRAVVVLALLLVATAWTRRARADIDVRLNAVADTTISEAATNNSSGKSPTMFAGKTHKNSESKARRALFRFDLSSIPANSVPTLVEVTLTLTNNSSSAGESTFRLAPVTDGSWGEGNSNPTKEFPKLAPAESGDATWITRSFGTANRNWGTPGGGTIAVSATASFKTLAQAAAPARVFSSASNPALITNVRNWLSGTANNGWILLGDESVGATAPLATIFWFGTVDGGNPAELHLKYKLPAGRACSAANDCTTGNCVDGICCQSTSCPGPTDCTPDQRCLANTGVCSTDILPNNTACTSDGLECTSDVCQAGTCKHNADRGGAACGSAPSGACDAQDRCEDGNTQCVDLKAAAGANCPSDNNPCTVDKCDGSSKTCPYTPGNKDAACGNAATLPCDVAEKCDGVHAACPTDAFAPAGTPCRDASCQSTAVAILPATCSGSSASCPAQQTQSCAPRVCTGVACEGACVSDTQCAAGNYCAPPDCLPKKANGASCGSAHECTSNSCIDGVCCNTACGGGDPNDCQSCSTGTCTLLTGVCRAAASGDKCDRAEVCTGSSASCPSDSVEPSSTVCQPATCSGGVETQQATCPGSGGKQCPAVVQRNCAPYVCGATACKTSCTSSADCDPANYCAANQCVPRLPRGGSCAATGQCQSGLTCVDGFCCNSACSGQCQACDVTPGTCTTVASGPPHGSRPACGSDGTLCAGSCNGTVTTSCAYPGTSTECIPASCSDGVETLRSVCNAAGRCNTMQQADCSPFSCGPTACFGNCASNVQCEAGKYCLAGNCVPKLDDGGVCASGSQCKSNLCVDGTCCNSTCEGQCEACNVAGSEGTCSPVVGSPVGGRPQCVDDGTLCGGVCDGKLRTSCAYLGAGSRCREDKCANDVATLGAFCNGAGTCPPEVTQACGSVGCNSAKTRCDGDCIVDTDCALSQVCSAGICRNKGGNGSACTRDDECLGGICADGVCCNTVCQGQCEACDVAGKEGECTPVSGPPHGTRVPCATDGSACAGVCDGKVAKQCAYPNSETSCGPAASCSGGIARLPSFCVGSGSCPESLSQICPGACSGARCAGGCANDAACGAGKFCAAGVCVDKQTPGAVCSLDSQCASGFCVEGVCCSSACDQQCFSCAIPGQAGQCVPVTGAPRGGRVPCEGEGPCAAQCSGGLAGACAFPKSDVYCGVGSCSDGVASGLAVCSGAGTCLPPAQVDCAPYTCDGAAACLMECLGDDQCQDGFNCAFGVCVPDPTPGQGGAPSSAGAPGSAGEAAEPPVMGDGGAPPSGGAPPVTPTPQAGEPAEMPPGAAGAPSAGSGSGGSKDDGGCGCRVPHGSNSSWPALAGIGLGLLLARRRRSSRAVSPGRAAGRF